MQKNKLYIGNLSFKVNLMQLREEFSPCGEIESLRLIKDRKTGRSKGFAFISFVDVEGAERALMKDGDELEGRTLKVNVALEKGDANESRPARKEKQLPRSRSTGSSGSRLLDWIGGIITGLLLSGVICWLF